MAAFRIHKVKCSGYISGRIILHALQRKRTNSKIILVTQFIKVPQRSKLSRTQKKSEYQEPCVVIHSVRACLTGNNSVCLCSFTREGCHSTLKVSQLVPEAAETWQLNITNFNKLIYHYHHETCTKTAPYICTKSNFI